MLKTKTVILMKILIIVSILALLISCETIVEQKIYLTDTLQVINHDTVLIDNTSVMEFADDSEIPDSIKNLYLFDAHVLAYRDMEKYDPEFLNKIQIDKKLIHNYYNALIHFYNNQTADCDSITKIFKIHTFSEIILHDLIIVPDSSNTWIENWFSGNIKTGIKEVDSLINEYGFSINSTSSYFGLRFVVIKSKKILNIKAVAWIFNKIEGIKYAEPNGYAGYGNDIKVFQERNKLQFVFALNWGDCFAGCTAGHSWVFDIYYNGKIEFVTSGGGDVSDYYYFLRH